MKEKRLMELLGDIDEQFIEEAAPAENETRGIALRYIGIAASVIFVLFISADLLKHQLSYTDNNFSGMSDAAPMTQDTAEDAAEEAAAVSDTDGTDGMDEFAVNSASSENSISAKKQISAESTADTGGYADEYTVEDEADEAAPAVEITQETADGGAHIHSHYLIPHTVIDSLKEFIAENSCDSTEYDYEISDTPDNKFNLILPETEARLYYITQTDSKGYTGYIIIDENGNISPTLELLTD